MSSWLFLKLPIEDSCSLPSTSLPMARTSAVPGSTEDVLLKGFASLDMEEDRIETAQQVRPALSLRLLDYFKCPETGLIKRVLIRSSEHSKMFLTSELSSTFLILLVVAIKCFKPIAQ